MKKLINIVKIGGAVIDDHEKRDNFLKGFSLIKGPKILVHGGGKMATQVSEEMGITPRMIDGRRITDADTLRIVTMVYGGYINRNIVAKLQYYSCNALGLTGADGNIIPAHKRTNTEIDYGFVGDVEIDNINTENIMSLLKAGFIPVVCALTHDSQGNLLNTNADTMASALARAFGKTGYNVRLTYCFENKGVLRDINDENSLIKTINYQHYQELKQQNIIHAGMIPKLDNAFDALHDGVQEIKICHAMEVNVIENAGTSIVE